MKFPKLEEFTKEELYQQFEEDKIDIDFLFDYIVKRDEVYNKLIDRINELEEQKEGLRGTIESQTITTQSILDRMVELKTFAETKKFKENFESVAAWEFAKNQINNILDGVK